MHTKEKAVRDAAAALADAIIAARKAGLVVAWPTSFDQLANIAVSETTKSNADATVTVVAKGIEPGSPDAAKAEVAAQKAVDAVADPAIKK